MSVELEHFGIDQLKWGAQEFKRVFEYLRNLPSLQHFVRSEVIFGTKQDQVSMDESLFDDLGNGYIDYIKLSNPARLEFLALYKTKPGFNLYWEKGPGALDAKTISFVELSRVVPDLSLGSIRNTLLTQDIAIERDIPYYFLPNITLYWKTVMAPGYYEEFWDREVLLRAPAVAVREMDNGWIELQSYRDLMDPLSEESLGQVRRLACYLEKYHKQAWDSILTAPELYEGGDRRPGCAGCGYE